MSLGAISAVVTEAERRALGVLAQPLAVGPRIVACDEIYGNDRHGADLSVAVASNHRIAERGLPTGTSPLQRSGVSDPHRLADPAGLLPRRTVSDSRR